MAASNEGAERKVPMGVCPDCNKVWEMTQTEHDWWVKKVKEQPDLKFPVRCKSCREARQSGPTTPVTNEVKHGITVTRQVPIPHIEAQAPTVAPAVTAVPVPVAPIKLSTLSEHNLLQVAHVLLLGQNPNQALLGALRKELQARFSGDDSVEIAMLIGAEV